MLLSLKGMMEMKPGAEDMVSEVQAGEMQGYGTGDCSCGGGNGAVDTG